MRTVARQVFVIGTMLVVASVLIQVLLAGLGVFEDARFFFWHANVSGAVVFFLPLLVVALGWYGRVAGRLLWLTVAVPSLVIVQSLLLLPYHMSALGALRPIASLHVLNALLIFWVAIHLMDQSRRMDVTEPHGATSAGRHDRERA